MAELTVEYPVARRCWALGIANWALAVVAWSISAYLGAARPTSMSLYTILLVIGLFAVIIGIVCFVIARFGREPSE